MIHIGKFDWWCVGAAGFGVLVVLAGCNYWIAGPVLLVLALSAWPQYYVTTPGGLLVRAGLMRRLIPYQSITIIEPSGEDTVKVRYGRNSLVLAPEDPAAFCRDLTRRLSMAA